MVFGVVSFVVVWCVLSCGVMSGIVWCAILWCVALCSVVVVVWLGVV